MWGLMGIRLMCLNKKGLGTVEMVLLIAVLVGVALLFKSAIGGFVKEATGQIFSIEIIDQATTPP